jgi:undecaprenyl-diphosphatase
MTIFQAIILGVVQGVTEFLPVSSSGHLILFPALLGWEIDSIAFDVALHLATLGAIVVALWPRISAWTKEIAAGNRSARRLAMYLVFATIPAALFGVLAHDWLEVQRTLPVVGAMLILWGVVLYIADIVSERVERTVLRDDKISLSTALLIGCAQMFALIPGTSRSGTSISAGLFLGLNRKTAATFSFLLAIPAILGAGTLTALDVAQTGLDVAVTPLLIGCITAFFTGILAIRFLFAVIEKGGFRWFALYRVLLGLLVLLVWSLG